MSGADKDALLALAERVESATDASFALELEIADAIGWPASMLPRPFTASLDAAMSLVPKGYDVALYMSDNVAHAGLALTDPEVRTADTDDAMAATPAFALTAAALRARAGVA